MKNFVQPGDVIDVIAPTGGVLSGQPFLVGAMFGVASGDAIEGATVAMQVSGVFDLTKASGAIAQGAGVYWDASPGILTGTASGNVLVGVATEAASADAASVRVRLNGVSLPAAAA